MERILGTWESLQHLKNPTDHFDQNLGIVKGRELALGHRGFEHQTAKLEAFQPTVWKLWKSLEREK